jgi:PAS domain S-box-containing protein
MKLVFKSMFEKVSLPLLIITQEAQILFANKGLEDLTLFSRQELIGVNLGQLCAPYERDRYIFSHLAAIKDSTEVDIDLRKKGGLSFMANISFSPFFHRGDFFLLLVVRDVTTRRVQEGRIREEEERYHKLLAERNHLENQLNRSNKLASLGELAAGIAHEINNPLGIILGFAQDILEDLPADSPLFDSLKIIEQETSRTVEVVKNLLDFARLRPPQISENDLVRLLKDSLALLMPKIKQNKINVKKDLARGLPCAIIDPQLIQQVFLNVLLNAIQAMPCGGDLCLNLELETADEKKSAALPPRLRVTVRDSGQGIAPEHLDRIFDPFFTTKGSKGTGLGLSVCQRILEDHCGRMEVRSRVGKGTTCAILLPTKLGDV